METDENMGLGLYEFSETGSPCTHHWIIESAEKGKTWLDAQCKLCYEERKYKSTMHTK